MAIHPQQPTQLCRVCHKINFAAILTPREWNKGDTEGGGGDAESRAIYRPECNGDGKAPDMKWGKYGKKNRKGKAGGEEEEDYLPLIRTAEYDELSVSSTLSDWDRDWGGRRVDLTWKGKGGEKEEEEEEDVDEVEEVLNEREASSSSMIDGTGSLAELKSSLEGRRLAGVKIGHEDVGKERLRKTLQDKTLHDINSQEKPFEDDQRQRVRESVPAEQDAQGAQLGQQIPHYNENQSGSHSKSLGKESENQPRLPPSELSRHDSDWESDEDETETAPKYGDNLPQVRSNDWFEGDDDYDDDSDDYDYDDDDDDDYDDDASDSTWSGNSHFTEIQRIDLEKQAQGNWAYRHGQLYYLGSIWDLRSRRHECRLCQRLWRQTRQDPAIKNEYLTKSRCIMKLMELKGRRTDGSDNEIFMLNLVYIYGYKLGDPFESNWIVSLPFVLQGAHKDVCDLRDGIPADRPILFDDRLFGEARMRHGTCDYGLLRQWLKMCETKHDHHVPRFTGEMMIRLIDVQQDRLIEWTGPTSEAPRFVALSYVWGMSQQEVMLTTDRLNEFKEPGFSDRPLNETISDSIELVSKMGEKYLWIDSLCILQDSPEDKAHQIPQMHKIYGKAIVTIVAAYGDDADSGLPGVRAGRQAGDQIELDLDDIRISFRSQSEFFGTDLDVGFVENYLRSSTYQSRAWTFQEGHLSTRMLVFTRDQVYWECEKTTWCEETHWESDSIDFVGWRAVKNACPQDEWNDRFDRRAYDMLGPDEVEKPEPPRNTYAALVKVYSNKQLSYDQDVLNACTGVLSSIKEQEKSDFLFALRTKHFGNDLLFNMMNAIPPRFPDLTSFEAGFPTWSWLSWKGTVEVANEARNNSWDPVTDLVPCDGVKCYMLETDQQGRKNLPLINETGGWRFRHDYVRAGEGIYDPARLFAPRNSYRDDESSGTNVEIQEYSQDLSLEDIESHSAFPHIAPNFHIIFRTFSSVVFLTSTGVKAGTKNARGGSMWESQNRIQRKLYACKKQPTRQDPSRKAEQQNPNTAHNDEAHPDAFATADPSHWPHDDPDSPTTAALPKGLVLGPFLGRLPDSWDTREYVKSVPDGIYRLLWMNNNQLPMLGHLLCKPLLGSGSASASAHASASEGWDGNCDNVILQRVSAAMGPTNVLSRGQQERYGVEWGVHILG